MMAEKGRGPDLEVYCRSIDQAKRKGPVVRMMGRRLVSGSAAAGGASDMLGRRQDGGEGLDSQPEDLE